MPLIRVNSWLKKLPLRSLCFLLLNSTLNRFFSQSNYTEGTEDHRGHGGPLVPWLVPRKRKFHGLGGKHFFVIFVSFCSKDLKRKLFVRVNTPEVLPASLISVVLCALCVIFFFLNPSHPVNPVNPVKKNNQFKQKLPLRFLCFLLLNSAYSSSSCEIWIEKFFSLFTLDPFSVFAPS